MAITDVALYAHLSREDIDALGAELDAIRQDIEDSRGARDAAYIRRAIRFQRTLDAAARLLIFASRSRTGWALGTASLAFAKSVENMELGHNIGHGQWDWMNDPEIHSNTWEWDMAGLSSQWRYSHNYRHHVFTNVLGVDDDLGFGIMRVTRDEPWQRKYLMQPLRNFCWRSSSNGASPCTALHAEHERVATEVEKTAQTKAFRGKVWRQVRKDYLLVPALSRASVAPHTGGQRRGQRPSQSVGVRGDLLRAFPGRGREVHRRRLGRTRPSLTGTCARCWGRRTSTPDRCWRSPAATSATRSNTTCFPTFRATATRRSPNGCVPCATSTTCRTPRVRSARQFLLSQRTILKLAVPDRFLIATSDDAPETASERKFVPARGSANRSQSTSGRPEW